MNRRPEGNWELAPGDLSVLLAGEVLLEGSRTATLQGAVREVVWWQPWPSELAHDWLGIDPPPVSHLRDNVAELVESARPLLRGADVSA